MTSKKISPISIIIPTLNEAEYLPKLLASIKKQTIQPLEVIVADAGSADQTVDIAAQAGCLITKGGLPGKARNSGARIAKGEYLLFLDSDVILPSHFIERALREFEKEYFEIATVLTRPLSTKNIDQVFFQLQRTFMTQLKELYPFTSGASILITKRMHRRIGGFNEKIRVGEDNDYGNRARALARFGVITSTYIKISVRRFEKEGRTKLIQIYLHHALLKQLRPLGIDSEVEYEFGDFAKMKSLSKSEQFLENLMGFIQKLAPSNTKKELEED